MDSREEFVYESEDRSEDGTGRREGAIGRDEGSMGISRGGSIDGGIWKPLPRHLGHKTGCLCWSVPPCE